MKVLVLKWLTFWALIRIVLGTTSRIKFWECFVWNEVVTFSKTNHSSLTRLPSKFPSKRHALFKPPPIIMFCKKVLFVEVHTEHGFQDPIACPDIFPLNNLFWIIREFIMDGKTWGVSKLWIFIKARFRNVSSSQFRLKGNPPLAPIIGIPKGEVKGEGWEEGVVRPSNNVSICRRQARFHSTRLLSSDFAMHK